MTANYQKWLKQHLAEAKVHYDEICRLDDQEFAVGGTSEYYEKAHQMFGYIAALEKCLKQATMLEHALAPKRATRPRE